VALAETEGANAALALLHTLAPDRRMQDYQPYWAARGHLLARLGRKDEAYAALTLAIGLATDNAVRHYLQQQVARLADA
jgi:RNA polymerase sigma-70 factor (ECF subfamily)